jgi:hypothetical protein
VDVSALLRLDEAQLARASRVIEACEECTPGAPKRRPGALKPFCINCGRDLVPGWDGADPRTQENPA